MKRTISILALALLAALVGSAWADGEQTPRPEKAEKAEKAPRGAEEKSEAKGVKLSGEYKMMATIAELDATQQEKMAALAKEQGEASKVFRAKMKEDRAELSEKAKAAREGDDKAKIEELAEQKKALYEREKAFRDSQAEARMAILTSDQKAKWQDFQVYRTLTRMLRKAELTEEQKAELREMCKGEGKSVESAADGKAREVALGKLRQTAVENILTDEQKEKLKAPARKEKEAKQPEEKKDRPEKDKQKKDKGAGDDESEGSAEG